MRLKGKFAFFHVNASQSVFVVNVVNWDKKSSACDIPTMNTVFSCSIYSSSDTTDVISFKKEPQVISAIFFLSAFALLSKCQKLCAATAEWAEEVRVLFTPLVQITWFKSVDELILICISLWCDLVSHRQNFKRTKIYQQKPWGSCYSIHWSEITSVKSSLLQPFHKYFECVVIFMHFL